MDSSIIILISTAITGLFAVIGLCIRYSFLSKCIKLKFCCFECVRDPENENKEVNNIMNNNHNRNIENIDL